MIGYISFLLMTFLISFICGIFVVPQITNFCKKKNLYDAPNLRKVHTTNIPRMGGICFVPCMVVAALFTVLVYKYYNGQTVTIGLWSCLFLVSILMIYIVGFVDDVTGVKPRTKFIVQIIAASLMPFSGLYINNLYGFLGIETIPFWVGAPLTVFIMVFVDNAMNLIDGIDGLAGGLASMSLIGFLYCFMREGLFVYCVLIAGLIGVVMSFLYYNLTGGRGGRYKIFMGDSGSLSLGFILSFLLIKFTMHNPAVMPFRSDSLLLSYTLLIVPCFDVVRVVLSRMRSRQPLFKADKRHIHHKLLRCGLSQHCALVTILILQLLFGVINMLLFQVISLNSIVIIDIAVFVVFNLALDVLIHRKERLATVR